jgi:hypothetical protein
MSPLVNSIVLTTFGSALSFVVAWYWFTRHARVRDADRAREEQSILRGRVTELEKQLIAIGTQVVPMNAAFQAILIKELTHAHTPRMDELLVKLGPPYILTDQEAAELSTALEARYKNIDALVDESERDAAKILPLVMKRVKAEAELLMADPNTPLVLRVVTNVQEPPEQT